MSSVEQEKAKKSWNSLVVRVSRPVKQVQFSGFKEIYEYTVEHQEPPPEQVVEPEVPPPPTMQITEDELNERIASSFKQGLAEGAKMKEEELLSQLQQEYALLQNIGQQIVQIKTSFLEKSEEIVIRLALHIAEKIVRTELQVNPEALTANIRNALHNLSAVDSNIVVRLHPRDMETIRARQEALQVPFTEMEFKPDPQLSRGSCVVETNYSTIDATVETQIGTMVETMLKELADD